MIFTASGTCEYCGKRPYQSHQQIDGWLLEIGTWRHPWTFICLENVDPLLAAPEPEEPIKIYICGAFHIPQQSPQIFWTQKCQRQHQIHHLEAHQQYAGESRTRKTQLHPQFCQRVWKERCFAQSTRSSIGSTTMNTSWLITGEYPIRT